MIPSYKAEIDALEKQIRQGMESICQELLRQTSFKGYRFWLYLHNQQMIKKVHKKISLMGGVISSTLNNAVSIVVTDSNFFERENIIYLNGLKSNLELMSCASHLIEKTNSHAIKKLKLFIQRNVNIKDDSLLDIANVISCPDLRFTQVNELLGLIKKTKVNSLQWHMARGMDKAISLHSYMFVISSFAKTNSKSEHAILEYGGLITNYQAPRGTLIFRSPNSVMYTDMEYYETEKKYYEDLQLFMKKKSTVDVSMMKPTYSYCSVCQNKFGDYFEHIKSEAHIHKDKVSSDVYHSITCLFKEQDDLVNKRQRIFKVYRADGNLVHDNENNKRQQITIEHFFRKPEDDFAVKRKNINNIIC